MKKIKKDDVKKRSTKAAASARRIYWQHSSPLGQTLGEYQQEEMEEEKDEAEDDDDKEHERQGVGKRQLDEGR